MQNMYSHLQSALADSLNDRLLADSLNDRLLAVHANLQQHFPVSGIPHVCPPIDPLTS